MNIDYKRLQKLNMEKQSSSSWSLCLLGYLKLIGALRELQWTHREILAYLLDSDTTLARLYETKPINNNQLSSICSKWKARGLFEQFKDEIKSEVQKIKSHKTEEQIEEELLNDFTKV